MRAVDVPQQGSLSSLLGLDSGVRKLYQNGKPALCNFSSVDQIIELLPAEATACIALNETGRTYAESIRRSEHAVDGFLERGIRLRTAQHAQRLQFRTVRAR